MDIVLITRLVAYALMIPAAMVLAVQAWNFGRERMAGLFAAFLLSYMLNLLVVVMDLYRVDRTISDGVRLFLTPVVTVQAVLYIWIVMRRLGEQRRRARWLESQPEKEEEE